jgi:hypothetical protein
MKVRRMHRSRRAHAALLAIGFGLLGSTPRAAEDPGKALEYSVKAAYLYKFGAFVDWPAERFPTPASPMVLCLVSQDSFGDVVESIVEGQRIRDRPIAVRRLKQADASSDCHTLYIDVESVGNLDAMLDATTGRAVLTVLSESPREKQAHGVITFLVKSNRLRFTIDAEAAKQSGLVISSRLLSMALQPESEG